MILLPVTALFDQPWTLPAPSLATVAALLGLALLCTAFAYVLFFRLLSTAGATNLLLGTILSPVSAVILGSLFLSEEIALTGVLGLITIGVGLAAIDGRPIAFLRQKRLPDAAEEKLG